MEWMANWIVPQADMGRLCPEYVFRFSVSSPFAPRGCI